MKKRGISQETLKLIACVTMLCDHIGAVFVPGAPGYQLYYALRIIGRIAFPIYCFLLAEGAYYTRNPKKYALRLAIGAVLSELPFDFAFFGGWTMEYQNVMLTLLLGFGALEAMKKCPNLLLKLLAVVPFALVAEWLKTDYGGFGVVLIALYGLVRGMPHEGWLRLLGTVLACWLMGSAEIPILGIWIPIELFAVLALVPIALYTGKKVTGNKAVQWGFYLFYPVHLTVLYLLLIV